MVSREWIRPDRWNTSTGRYLKQTVLIPLCFIVMTLRLTLSDYRHIICLRLLQNKHMPGCHSTAGRSLFALVYIEVGNRLECVKSKTDVPLLITGWIWLISPINLDEVIRSGKKSMSLSSREKWSEMHDREPYQWSVPTASYTTRPFK